MAELRWIQIALFLILVPQFTAVFLAVFGMHFLSTTVRDGDEVTLASNSVIDDHENCNSTQWIFGNSTLSSQVHLVTNGTIVEEANAKSDRLNVSETCSLVIKNVTDEDAGFYIFSSGQHRGLVHLGVVTLTEQEDNDEVTLNCSHSISDRCVQTMKWLFHGQDIAEDNKDFNTSQYECSVSLKFLTSHSSYTSRFNSFKCEVDEGDRVHQFSFINLPSGDDAITATTESTPTEDGREAGWWWFIFVSVTLAALIIIVVAVNIRARIKEKKTRMDQIAVRYDGEYDAVTYENIRPPDGV